VATVELQQKSGHPRPDITEDYERTASLKVVDRENPSFRTVDQLTLDSVELTYFSPVDPAVQPASVEGAFLVVDASEQTDPESHDSLGWIAAMPPSRMSLVLPGGKVIEAEPTSSDPAPPEDLLDGTYYFDVPTSITKATIEITPGTNEATEYGPDNNGNSQDTVLGTASFAIAFPPPPKAATKLRRKATSKAGVPTTAVVHTGPASSPAKQPRFPIPLPELAVAVVLLVALLARSTLSRHRHGSAPLVADATSNHVRRPPQLAAASRYAEAFVSGPDGATTAPYGEPTGIAAAAGPPPIEEEAKSAKAEPTDDALLRPDVAVNVLGPLTITGLGSEPKRRVVLELLCFLACHNDRRFTADQIRAEMWPSTDGGEHVSAKSFRTYVSGLRAVIGRGQFPEAFDGFYEIGSSVDTDWDRFRTLVSFAHALPDDARMLLSSALGLIRGQLFSGVPTGRYAWAFGGGLVNEMAVAINAAAGDLAELCLAGEEPEIALAGLAKALFATKDFGVADDLLTAAGASGNLSALERAWRDVTGALGDDAERFRRSYEARRRVLQPASWRSPV
jgi:hypothetical protein